MVGYLWGCTAVVLPGDGVVLQDHHSAVVSVVGLVTRTVPTPDIIHQLCIIVDPQPLSLSP